jgi:hypothetical protein
MIVPTVGRVVWFYQNGLRDTLTEKQPRAAIIAFVHNDRCVNLAVFDRNGKSFGLTSITLIQEGDDAPSKGDLSFCCWMPYQIGQAKAAGARAGAEGDTADSAAVAAAASSVAGSVACGGV